MLMALASPLALIGGPGLGWPEMLLLLLIVVVIFGARRLGDVGKGLGDGIRNFRSAVKDASSDDDNETAKKEN